MRASSSSPINLVLVFCDMLARREYSLSHPQCRFTTEFQHLDSVPPEAPKTPSAWVLSVYCSALHRRSYHMMYRIAESPQIAFVDCSVRDPGVSSAAIHHSSTELPTVCIPTPKESLAVPTITARQQHNGAREGIAIVDFAADVILEALGFLPSIYVVCKSGPSCSDSPIKRLVRKDQLFSLPPSSLSRDGRPHLSQPPLVLFGHTRDRNPSALLLVASDSKDCSAGKFSKVSRSAAPPSTFLASVCVGVCCMSYPIIPLIFTIVVVHPLDLTSQEHIRYVRGLDRSSPGGKVHRIVDGDVWICVNCHR